MPKGLQRGLAAALLSCSLHPWLAPARADGIACPMAEASAELPMPAPAPADSAKVTAAAAGTYSDKLSPTPLGWPLRDHWCIWIQPAAEAAGTAAASREQQWLDAVDAALLEWQRLIPITRVAHPDQAQVRIWRRRPPLQRLSNGRTRASNGRAVLLLLAVQRQQRWRPEPRVEVLLGTTQGPKALQATALHELGHAFGIWGHSDQAGDAMAIQAGPVPVLRLSDRDRQTLQWLQRQGGRLQMPPRTPESPAAARSPQPAPRAD